MVKMDIITDFGTVVPGSSPGGCTKVTQKATFSRKWPFELGSKTTLLPCLGAKRKHISAIHSAEIVELG